jgi:aminopeptidase N
MTRLTLLRRTAIVATALLLPAGVAIAAPAGPGSPGIGDPYYPNYGNGGYDVRHYNIDVAYTPGSDRLSGVTKIRARATQKLSRFNLDFVLPVSRVRVNHRPATYTQTAHELIVTPHHSLRRGARMSISVKYAGIPSTEFADGINPWIRTADGVAAVGEPEIAAWWYPSNDHPRDKATYDVRVTVAKSLEALGNGVLVSKRAHGNHRTWHWREHKPMATYLAFFVVGQFDITRSKTKAGLPVINAVASNGGSEGEFAAKDLARTPEVIRFESRHFGKYPFEAMGGVAPAADFGFALENQTRPVYTRGFWSGGPNIYVIVHELAHQWYGDSVSVHNWRDIWLNEGFASFAEWLWSEKHGEGTGKQLFQAYWDFYRGDTDFWSVTIGDPGAHNEFDGAVYDRGAMTLQALRTRIGGPAFATTMRKWAAQHRYANGSIRQFINLAERVSGRHLGSFFKAWLYTGHAPAPTRANGFPPGFQPRTSARIAMPGSWRTIQHTHTLLQQAERR